MNQTLERNLWRWLKSGLPTNVHAQRIENGVARGTPDVEACGNGTSTWVELKVGRPHGEWYDLNHLTQQQAMWHWERTRAGGTSWFLVQLGKERFLVPGRYAQTLRSNRGHVSRGLLLTLKDGMYAVSAPEVWWLILNF